MFHTSYLFYMMNLWWSLSLRAFLWTNFQLKSHWPKFDLSSCSMTNFGSLYHIALLSFSLMHVLSCALCLFYIGNDKYCHIFQISLWLLSLILLWFCNIFAVFFMLTIYNQPLQFMINSHNFEIYVCTFVYHLLQLQALLHAIIHSALGKSEHWKCFWTDMWTHLTVHLTVHE